MVAPSNDDDVDDDEPDVSTVHCRAQRQPARTTGQKRACTAQTYQNSEADIAEFADSCANCLVKQSEFGVMGAGHLSGNVLKPLAICPTNRSP